MIEGFGSEFSRKGSSVTGYGIVAFVVLPVGESTEKLEESACLRSQGLIKYKE